ncbi:hypothetical protein ACVWZ6_008284 [Bradyrhizobium sp. GM6.1]
MCSTFNSCHGAAEKGNAFDAHEGFVADLLNIEDVGERHQTVADGAQMLGALEAELSTGLHGDRDRASRLLLHLFREGKRVLGVEIAVGPYRRHVPAYRRRSRAGRDVAGCEQRRCARGKSPSRDH